ncbi:hypothetical protein NC652_002816 [Populus alba x Populus x berolinensis]|nr:hypothetical protein NC652_002816 [Populus alba x Populus x berolinensis]
MILLLLITWMLFLPCLFFRIQRLKNKEKVLDMFLITSPLSDQMIQELPLHYTNNYNGA